MLSSLSTFTIVALCVGATVLPACAAPLSASYDVDLQRRIVPDSGFINDVWMDTSALSTGSSDDQLPDVSESALISVVQGAFQSFLLSGIIGLNIPATGQVSGSFPGSDFGITAFVTGETTLDPNDPALTDWFATAQADVEDTANNLATFVGNQMSSAGVSRVCGQPYYNNDEPWGVIFVQVTSATGGTFDNGNVIQADFAACTVATY